MKSKTIMYTKVKALIQPRVSSKEQLETGYSIEAQEKLLLEYVNKKEFLVSKIFRIVESASNKQGRQSMGEMFQYADKHGIDIIVVEKVDRITRNIKDAAIIDDWIHARDGREIHCVKEGFVLSRNTKAHENFIWDMKVAVARFYTNNLSEEVKKGQKEKIAQGWLPTKPPLGYKTIGEKGHKIHIVEEKTAKYVKKIFELYGSGNYSMKAVIETLYSEGLRTRAGNKMVKSVIESILNNPFYYGAMEWNGETFPAVHEALITKELFDKCKAIRLGKKSPHYTKRQFQFRKMILCGECKGTITADLHKGIVYYHCNHYRNCSQRKNTPEGKLEQQLLGVFKFFENVTPEEAEEIKSKIKENHAQEIVYKENALKAINDHYNVLQKRIDNTYIDRLDERITILEWEKRNKALVEEQSATLEQINKLKTEEADYFEIWLNILDLARRAGKIYQKRSPEERRILLSHIFSNMMLTDEKLTYDLKSPIAVLAQRVQERLDNEKFFEPTRKTAETIVSSGNSHSVLNDFSSGISESLKHFRTSKNPSVKARPRQNLSASRPLLRR